MNQINLNSLSVNELKILNKINLSINKDFLRLIDQIYKDTDSSIDWLTNSVLSRDIHLSSIYIDLCYIELVKQIVKKNKIKKIIAQNYAQKKVLEDKFPNLEIVSKSIIFSKINNLSFFLKGLFKNIFYSFKLLLVKSEVRKSEVLRKKGISLLDIFFIPSMFKNNTYQERYYPGFLESIKNKHKDKIYFFPNILYLKNISKSLKIANQSKKNFVFNFDFLKFSDYLYAIFSFLRIRKINFYKYTFRGSKIGPILKNDFDKNLTNFSSFLGLLNYRFFKQAKNSDLDLRLVINWFENQVVDRGFNKGKNVFYPKIESKGFVGYLNAFDYVFHYAPSKTEYITKVLPDKILVTGKKIIKKIRKNCPNLKVITAPAYRNNYLFLKSKIKKKNKKKKRILVLLNGSFEESLNIMNSVLKFEKHFPDKMLTIKIKPHVALDIDLMKKRLPKLPKRFIFIKGNLDKIIKNFDVTISNMSTVCIESVIYGVPAIIAGSRKSITASPIPYNLSKTMWNVCYSTTEYINTINTFCFTKKNFQKKYIKISNDLKNSYFNEVTERKTLSFLNLV